MWNVAQQSQIQVIEVNYLRDACGGSRWDGESNERVYERFSTGITVVGMDCG